jgi:hypothetical protein
MKDTDPFVYTQKVTIIQYDDDQDAIEDEMRLIFNSLPQSAKNVVISLLERGKFIIWRKKK